MTNGSWRSVIASVTLVPLAVFAQRPLPTPVFQATTELVQVNVVALDQHGKPVADLKREEFQIRDAIVGVESLGLLPDQDRWTGTIEFAARFTTADAIVASDPITRTVSFHLSREKYDAALRTGITYHHELQIPPKAVELKLLFANAASGKIGTLTIPLSRVKTGAAALRQD